jgi:hypothetical protein
MQHLRYAIGGLIVAVVLIASSALADTKIKIDTDTDSGSEVKAKATVGSDSYVAFNWMGDTLALRPLDDPGNPYIADYTDYDRWVYTNIRPDWSPNKVVWENGRWVAPAGVPADWKVTAVRVDPQGYLLPSLGETTLKMGPIAPSALPDDEYYYVFAAGPAEDTVFKVYDDERVARVAPMFPDVPDWVIKQPAERVVFVPNNEYVVLDNGIWVRYDATGRVVAKAPAGTTTWRALYWPTFADAVKSANSRNWTWVESDGYTIFRDPSGKIVEVYDYQGNKVDFTTKVTRHPYYFTPLSVDEVGRIRDAKVRVSVKGGGDKNVKVNP